MARRKAAKAASDKLSAAVAPNGLPDTPGVPGDRKAPDDANDKFASASDAVKDDKLSSLGLVEAIDMGGLWRVLEADGTPANGHRNPSDGGGFVDERDALHVVALINGRRTERA